MGSKQPALSLLLGGCLLALTCFAAVSPAVWSQTATGRRAVTMDDGPRLEGVVVADGGPIRGAVVVLVHRNATEVARSYTDESGEFGFYDLAEGNYRLVATHPDFQEASVEVDLFGRSLPDLRIVLHRRASSQEYGAEAATVPRWALAVPSEAREAYGQGLRLLREGQAEKSLTHLNIAVSLYPEYAAAYSALGAAHLTLNDQEAAVAAFEQALEIDPNLLDACLGLGALYRVQGRDAEAEKLLRRTLRQKADDWRIYYELGELYWKADDWEKAERNLRRAEELGTPLPRVSLLLVNVLALQEKYSETLAAMDRYLELFPQDSFAEQVRKKRELLVAEMKEAAAAKEKQ